MPAARLLAITACTGAALFTVIACGSSSSNPAGSSGAPAIDASSGSTGSDAAIMVDGEAGSSGSSGTDGGGIDADPPVRARAVVTSSLSACADASAVIALGTFGPPAVSVDDGSTQGGLGVSVNCFVSANAAMGFDVDATISIATVGSLHVQGTVDTTGATTNANAQLNKSGKGEWASTTGCTLDPNVMPGVSGVADGRYWAGLHCTGATVEGHPACDIDAQIRLENCRF